MKKGKTMIMRIIMSNKNITIEANLIDTKEENILRRRFFTLEMIVARLKKVMYMFLILKKKNSSSWPWIQSLPIKKVKTIRKKKENKKENTLMGK
jgi:hypothetical protein